MELWGDDHVQQQLDTTPKRNIDIFRRVCQDIKDRLPEFLDNYLCNEMFLFSSTQHFLFPPDFLFWRFI
jgi:GTP cyclohydrolase I